MSPTSGPPRSLTQMLRDRDDAALIRLLLARPDLGAPRPTDLSQVASQATTRYSVLEALASLTAFDLWVAAVSCRHDGPKSWEDLALELAGAGAPLGAIDSALHRLTDLALFWGGPDSLRPVRVLPGLLGDTPPDSTPPPTGPPGFEHAPRQSTSLVDKVATGSAFEFVRRVEVLVEHCDHVPLKVRRQGKPSAREMKVLAELLDVPAAVATGCLEIAQAAGLLGVVPHGSDTAMLPTPRFDRWEAHTLADQWGDLVAAWYDRHEPSGPAWLKRLCLDAFGDPLEGRVLTSDDIRTWLAWCRPRRPAGTDQQAAVMLDQASWLGITGLGALASFAVGIDRNALGAMLPARGEHVLIQADLTAVAPGPLTPEAARDLGALGDIESRGGATVYRFSTESLRRAHDLGWSVADIEAALEQRSTTPVPQPLRYLVADLGRRPMAGRPTAAWDLEGHRTPERAPLSPPADQDETVRLSEDEAREIVRGLRVAGTDEKAPAQRTNAVFDSPVDTLREAVETGEAVWFGFVDPAGTTGERLVKATAVEDGRLRARDARSDEVLSVPVHRITSAHIIRTGS